jgi:hypothetical protein
MRSSPDLFDRALTRAAEQIVRAHQAPDLPSKLGSPPPERSTRRWDT